MYQSRIQKMDRDCLILLYSGYFNGPNKESKNIKIIEPHGRMQVLQPTVLTRTFGQFFFPLGEIINFFFE